MQLWLGRAMWLLKMNAWEAQEDKKFAFTVTGKKTTLDKNDTFKRYSGVSLGTDEEVDYTMKVRE